MQGTYLEQAVHFSSIVIANALVVLCVVFLLWLNEHFGWKLPLELGDILKVFPSDGQQKGRRLVNVELRGRGDSLIDLGEFISVILRSSQGDSYTFNDGYFRRCHLNSIWPGSEAKVIFGGLISEKVVVQVDLGKHVLFVESMFRQDELLNRLFHGSSTQ